MLSQNQQIFAQIEKAKQILLVFPSDWNGDAISSSLAWFLLLRKLGKNVEIAAAAPRADFGSSSAGRQFSFLPGFTEIKNSLDNLYRFIVSLDIKNAKVDQIKYVIENDVLNFIVSPKEGFFTSDDVRSDAGGFKYDLIISLNSPDLESLGEIYDSNVNFFFKTTIINIDHNSSNEEYGQINLVDLNAVATAEISYDLFKNYRADILDEDITTCLLTGIIYKTKNFKTPNLTPHSLLVTSELIHAGARREEIVGRLYQSREFNVLKLWGRILNNLNATSDQRLVWSYLLNNDFSETNCNEEQLEDVIEELIVNIPTVRVIVLAYSLKEISGALKTEPASDIQPLTEIIPSSTSSDQDKNQTIVVHNGDQEIFSTKVLVYSVKNTNSMDLLKGFNPSGGKRVAATIINKPLAMAQREVLDSINSKLEKIIF